MFTALRHFFRHQTFSWILAWFMTILGAGLIFTPQLFAKEVLYTLRPDPSRYGFSLLALGLSHYLLLLFESTRLILSIRRLLYWASSILIAAIGWQLLLSSGSFQLTGLPFLVVAIVIVTLTIIQIPGHTLDHLQELAKGQQKLGQLLTRMEAILQSTEEALIAIDKQGQIILFNAAACRLTGYSATEAIGQSPDQLLHFTDHQLRPLEEKHSPLMKAFHTGLTITTDEQQEYYITDAKHQQIPVHLTSSPVTDTTRQIIGAVCIIRDITIEKRLNQLQNEFVFIAAHELRNPVTAITGFLEMAMDTHPRSPRIRTALAAIEQANLQLTKLINNLLQVARTESGKLKLNLTKVNFTNLLNIVINLYHQDLNNKHLTLTTTLATPPDGYSVYADPNFVQEILVNLISNAIKYTPPRGKINLIQQLSLTANHYQAPSRSQSPQFLITHIADTGIGIPQSEHNKLFEKFFRASNIGDVEGNGLGMFLVKQLVEKQNGQIWFASEENQGTTFSFSLPLMADAKSQEV